MGPNQHEHVLVQKEPLHLEVAMPMQLTTILTNLSTDLCNVL